MILLAGVLAGLAVFLFGRPPPGRRLYGLSGRGFSPTAVRPPGSGGNEPETGRSSAETASGDPTRGLDRLLRGRGPRFVAAGAGGVAALLWGGWGGVVLGLVVGVVVDRVLSRMEPRAVRERRDRLGRDLPLAADLLAACLRAGRAPSTAVEAVAGGLGGPLGAELTVVAAALRLGAEPRVAWAAFLDDPTLSTFGATMARAWDSGAPLADALDRVARDLRGRQRSRAEQRARAVGVKAAAPLGLCFLPAFLLIGVVPVVIGAVTALLR